jgi:hypothetical protein
MGEDLEEEKARRGSAGRFRIIPDLIRTDLSDARTLGAATGGSRLPPSGANRMGGHARAAGETAGRAANRRR